VYCRHTGPLLAALAAPAPVQFVILRVCSALGQRERPPALAAHKCAQRRVPLTGLFLIPVVLARSAHDSLPPELHISITHRRSRLTASVVLCHSGSTRKQSVLTRFGPAGKSPRSRTNYVLVSVGSDSVLLLIKCNLETGNFRWLRSHQQLSANES
jgi:hypothetical protein